MLDIGARHNRSSPLLVERLSSNVERLRVKSFGYWGKRTDERLMRVDRLSEMPKSNDFDKEAEQHWTKIRPMSFYLLPKSLNHPTPVNQAQSTKQWSRWLETHIKWVLKSIDMKKPQNGSLSFHQTPCMHQKLKWHFIKHLACIKKTLKMKNPKG